VNKIFAIIYKDLRIRFTSKVEWLFFIILPVVFILVLSGGTGAPEDQRIHLEVVDLAQSDLSASLIEELGKSPSVKPELTPLKDAEADFESRQVSAILIIPDNFTVESLQKGEAEIEFRQQQNKLNALIDQQAVDLAVRRLSSFVDIAKASVEEAELIAPFDSETDRQRFFDDSFAEAQQMMADAPDRIDTKQGNTEDSINYDPRANSTFGQMITWVFIPLIGLSAMFAGEREWGTLRRLLITPTSKALYIGGTVFGQVLTAVFQMVILVTFGMLVLQIDFGGSIAALLLLIVTSALSAAALGTMLGTFVKTESQANGLSIMIGMVMAMMGGCWYPIELFPTSIQSAVKVLPTTWAMQGFLDVAVRDQGLSGVLLESGVLFGFALIFFVIGVWRFKYE
jgi:ABC-2 type transport system permease protein